MSSLDICTQPDCLLREEDVDCRALAKLIVRVIAGEDVSQVMDGKSPIRAYPRCTECALRVMGGEKPLPGIEELERLLEAGQSSHRRRRRQARREEHGVDG